MNILIKLMSIVSLVIAPTLATMHKAGPKANQVIEQKVDVRVSNSDTALVKSTMFADARTFKSLTSSLKQDGVISNDNVTLKMKDGVLYINDKQQPEDIRRKYESLFNGQLNFSVNIETKK
jgi:K(+)-stimulated pyrophosphate-energized sodium pump